MRDRHVKHLYPVDKPFSPSLLDARVRRYYPRVAPPHDRMRFSGVRPSWASVLQQNRVAELRCEPVWVVVGRRGVIGARFGLTDRGRTLTELQRDSLNLKPARPLLSEMRTCGDGEPR